MLAGKSGFLYMVNWDSIGATGEWAGAIAVVFTLFYLARQIHQQNINTSIQMQDSILDGFNQSIQVFAGSKELSSLFMKGLWNPEQLDDEEASQFQWMFRIIVNQYVKIFRMYQQGQLSDEDWQGHSAQGAYFFNAPGGKVFRDTHGEAFKEFFDTISSAKVDVDPMDVSFGRRSGEKP